MAGRNAPPRLARWFNAGGLAKCGRLNGGCGLRGKVIRLRSELLKKKDGRLLPLSGELLTLTVGDGHIAVWIALSPFSVRGNPSVPLERHER